MPKMILIVPFPFSDILAGFVSLVPLFSQNPSQYYPNTIRFDFFLNYELNWVEYGEILPNSNDELDLDDKLRDQNEQNLVEIGAV